MARLPVVSLESFAVVAVLLQRPYQSGDV